MKTPDKQFTKFLLKYFPEGSKGVFIEAGANTGYAGSVCYELEYSYDWTGINIEPNPYCFKELKVTRPNCINANYALSFRAGTVTFTFPTNGPRGNFAGQGSIIFKPQHWNGRPTVEIEVNTIRLEELIKIYNVSHIDLFVLDVEGAELDALRGMGQKILPSVICVEDDKISKEELNDMLVGIGYKKESNYKNNSIFKRA